MAGINAAKYKLMPESLETDLEAVKTAAKKIVDEFGGTNREYVEEPIAFGLKAVIVFFSYSDDKDTDALVDKFGEIENVQSARLIDMRKIA